MQEVKTEGAWERWLQDAKPGERVVYLRDAFVRDTYAKYAKRIMRGYEAGLVRLFQRRVSRDVNEFDYIAERISPEQHKRDLRLSIALANRFPLRRPAERAADV